jgi:nucleoside-diphosphate-sugar epimerase
VIGGAGYIGSALLPKLLDQGHQVRLLDLMFFGESPIAQVLSHPKLELIEGDFRHVESVLRCIHDVDTVVHLGAIVGDPACSLDESLTIDVNLSATRMVADVSKDAGVERFIFASTCSVYGACDETLDEHSMVKPVSLYGRTKLASERVLMSMADERFAPTLIRFATIYGFSGRTRFDLVVNLLAAKAKIDGEITVHGGNQWRPFVHVDDAARAVAMAVDAPSELVANQILNVGSNDQNYTIQQIAELVRDQVVSAKIITSEDAVDIRNYRVDFSKIRNELGFEPQWTVESGIHQVLEAIAEGNVTDYRDPRYSNVKFLTESGTTGLARDNWARELIRSISDQ